MVSNYRAAKKLTNPAHFYLYYFAGASDTFAGTTTIHGEIREHPTSKHSGHIQFTEDCTEDILYYTSYDSTIRHAWREDISYTISFVNAVRNQRRLLVCYEVTACRIVLPRPIHYGAVKKTCLEFISNGVRDGKTIKELLFKLPVIYKLTLI